MFSGKQKASLKDQHKMLSTHDKVHTCLNNTQHNITPVWGLHATLKGT